MAPASGPQTVWVDVEDFFLYFERNPRPSGIQRLVFETLRVLPARAALFAGAPRIAFVRHTGDERRLREVAFAEVAAVFSGFGGETAAAKRPAVPVRIGPRRTIGGRLRLGAVARIERLPPKVARPLLDAGVLQLNVFRSLKRLIAPARPAETVVPVKHPTVENRFGGRPGDVLLALGAPWELDGYASLLQALRIDHGISAALLLYDLIPLRRPEWCAAVLVKTFSAWLSDTLPLYSQLMAISHATARDVQAYADEIGLALPGPVQPVPIGTGFSAGSGQGGLPPVRGLPPPGSYVLFVSTLEARKNHALLFRVWRRLLAEMPRADVPTLVFAGRVGWLVADLMQQLENADWLDGKIRLLRDPTDAELAALYEGCQFTVFPSLFEGWGLPVSESLQHLRPCVASHCTSLPEAGGSLARYFDPENTGDAVRTIRAVIEDRAGLDAWRAQVARDFRPVPWERTADAILAACLPTPALDHER